MKRGRKDDHKNSPAQKTTILNFFQRRSTDSCSNSVEITPSSSQSIAQQTPVKSYIKCPACTQLVPRYSLNKHLDSECTSLKNEGDELVEVVDLEPSAREDPIKIGTSPPQIKKFTVLKEFSKRSTAHPTTPPKLDQLRVVQSTSKKNLVRKQNLAAELQDAPTTKDEKSLRRSQSFSQLATRRRLFEDEEPSPKRYRQMPYYLENFLFCINSTFNEPLYHHLFDNDDKKWYETFKSLSLDAKKLYVRLFTRKHSWRRREKIDYKEEIGPDLNPQLLELVTSGLLIDISQLNDLPTLLKLLMQPELKQICRDMKLPFNSKGNACQDLMDHCRKQPCLMGRGRSMNQVIEAKAKALIKSCFKLSEQPRRVFLRFYMLGSLHQRQEDEDDKGQQQQQFTSLLVNTGRLQFPQYRIIRERSIFQHRDHLIRYEEAVNLESQVRDALEKLQIQQVVDLTDGIAAIFKQNLKESQHDIQLPDFLRRFTAGSIHVYCLNKRIEALQRLKRHQEAVDLLSMLIAQEVYLLAHRGHWYERLALNMEQHLKNPQQALKVIGDGLEDPWVTPSHKLALSQRASRICQSARQKEKLSCILSQLSLLTAAEPRSVTITGRHLPRDLPGHKSMFIRGDSTATLNDGDVTLCSVEELVLQHYKENGYSHGVHSEGSIVCTLVGLLFWDIIYESEVGDAFLSPFQAVPLDFHTQDFYRSRQEAIERRLECVRSWSCEALIDHVTRVWHDKKGQTSLVAWDRFADVDTIQGLLLCIPPSVMAAISNRLLRDYRHFRSGFPDLTVWNPVNKTWRIVEVKGPNDRLSTKQILWLDFLVSNGVEAEVCHVEAVGAKRMGATAQARQVKGGSMKSPKKVKQPDVVGEEMETAKMAPETPVRKSRRKRAKLDP